MGSIVGSSAFGEEVTVKRCFELVARHFPLRVSRCRARSFTRCLFKCGCTVGVFRKMLVRILRLGQGALLVSSSRAFAHFRELRQASLWSHPSSMVEVSCLKQSSGILSALSCVFLRKSISGSIGLGICFSEINL